MNKLRITFVTIFASLLLTVSSFAEVRIGVSAGFNMIEAAGSETIKDSNAVTTHTEQANAIIPSIFLELAMANGLGVGLDMITGSADLAGSGRTSNKTAGGIAGEGNDVQTNTANAEVDGITTAYLIKTFGSGLFVKLGVSQADVNTKETLGTGTTYGNTSVDGMNYGIGYELKKDSGLFIRTAVEYTDFDSVNLTGSEVGGTASSFNRIKADVDVTTAKLSVGKAF